MCVQKIVREKMIDIFLWWEEERLPFHKASNDTYGEFIYFSGLLWVRIRSMIIVDFSLASFWLFKLKSWFETHQLEGRVKLQTLGLIKAHFFYKPLSRWKAKKSRIWLGEMYAAVGDVWRQPFLSPDSFWLS